MNTFFERKTLWAADDVYTNYRIPGITVTDKGTLLVYCEARKTASDWASMDILLQRSQDQGKTFSPPVVLAAGSEEHNTVNNPVMVQARTGRIHFLYCEDYSIRGGRVLHRFSDDDGLSWSEPTDITAATRPEYRNAFALGPGHGIVTQDGTLVIPVWMVPKSFGAPLQAHSPSVISTLYNRDNGQSWALGDILESNREIISPNETEAAPTSDGRVYLNIRHLGYSRARAYSPNGYSHWQHYGPDRQLPDPRCFGAVAAYDDGVNPYSLIFVNCGTNSGRTHVTLRLSTDDGQTFPIAKLIDEERGGYTEIAADSKNGLIYVLYEENKGEADHLAIFNYQWLSGNN